MIPEKFVFPIHVPTRHPTREVRIGPLRIGADNPILVQSMTIADTCDTESVVREILGLADAGCPLVRVTAPSIKDAENLGEIKRRLRAAGRDVPLVADIHFTPNAALEAARHVEKVRINPGNYADRKKFEVFEISDAAYREGIERLRERFLPLVRVLKTEGRALRIGTNHGSLSDRILNRYGDTPEGMVESALEFVRICRDEGFHEIVLSMKSSIPSVMVAAYRLLAQKMRAEGMDYPLHIGVTEAGDGLEGRVKSAVGIGSLLASGIGDTIRVSLTEDSIHEVAACRNLLAAVTRETRAGAVPGAEPAAVWTGLSLRSSPERRASCEWKLGRWPLGDRHRIAVELRVPLSASGEIAARWGALLGRAGREDGPEIVSVQMPPEANVNAAQNTALRDLRARLGIVPLVCELPGSRPDEATLASLAPLVDGVSLQLPATSGRCDIGEARRVLAWGAASGRRIRWRLPLETSADAAAAASRLAREEGLPPAAFACGPGPQWIARSRALARAVGDDPVFLEVPSSGASAPALAGTLLLDGIGDALCLLDPELWPAGGEPAAAWPAGGVPWLEDPLTSAYHILQACRIRLTRTEFIACPSCGRTQFDLQSTTARIRARTGHLKGVKLAIMGCIVNGPGEMADADFGYVGSGAGRVDLYVGKERVAKNIPAAEAEDRLVALLREQGVWVEPPPAS